MKSWIRIILTFIIGLILVVAAYSLGAQYPDEFHGFDIRFRASRIDDISINDIKDIDTLKIDASMIDVRVHESDEYRLTATHLYDGFTLKQDGHTITIDQPAYWATKIEHEAAIDIYVPKDYTFNRIEIDGAVGKSSFNGLKAKSMNIDLGMGNFDLDDLTCESLDLDVGMSEAVFTDVNCSDKANIDVSMGNLDIEFLTSQYSYSTDVGMGNVTINGASYSGIAHQKQDSSEGLNMDVKCGFGNINIETED